jgi:hypothetical protein
MMHHESAIFERPNPILASQEAKWPTVFSNFTKVRFRPFRTLRKFDVHIIELCRSSIQAISNFLKVRFRQYRTSSKFDRGNIELYRSSIQAISNFGKVRAELLESSTTRTSNFGQVRSNFGRVRTESHRSFLLENSTTFELPTWMIGHVGSAKVVVFSNTDVRFQVPGTTRQLY